MGPGGPPSPVEPVPWEPFDPGYTRGLIEDVFGPALEHYFRPRLLGAERLPGRGPLVLAANHSGTAFPYDGLVLDGLLWSRDGMRPEAKFRSVYERRLSLKWWMRPFGLDDFWRRCGGVDLTFDNFDRLLARGERVAYYPEGIAGIGKGFQRRYRLQRFSTSFIVLAARHRAPVFPVSVVNAEWVVPFNLTFRPLNFVMQRVFGVPFMPLPAGPLAVVFPWAWYLSLPARMTFVVGEPLDVRAMCEAEGIVNFDRDDRPRLERVAARVRRAMQAELDRHVATHGRQPYEARSLWRELRRASRQRRLGRVLPTGWPLAFVRHERDRQRPPARGRLHGLLRDWDVAGFYLPLGWPLLSLTRAWRRPPCGYRGLGRAERARREGRFVWHLAERPLPPRSPSPSRSSREEA